MTIKLVLMLLILRGENISSSTTRDNKPQKDYSYIGEYCKPSEFARLPCLQQFCADIDHEIHVWTSKNASNESKLNEL